MSLSSAAFADDMPPPYPGTARSAARYESARNDPPGRMSGPSRATIEVNEYALTPMGRTLLETVGELVSWADSHLPEIEAARAAYDARHPAE